MSRLPRNDGHGPRRLHGHAFGYTSVGGLSGGKEFSEFVLPYEAVRTAASPEADLRAFLHTTYDAAAQLGRWDREDLERR